MFRYNSTSDFLDLYFSHIDHGIFGNKRGQSLKQKRSYRKHKVRAANKQAHASRLRNRRSA
jgi:hypothetical protein